MQFFHYFFVCIASNTGSCIKDTAGLVNRENRTLYLMLLKMTAGGYIGEKPARSCCKNKHQSKDEISQINF